MISDLTLCTCSYNTPLVTVTMLKSWFKRHPYPCAVSIIENSTNDSTSQLLDKEGVPYTRNPGGKHELTVDLALDQVKTRYALLVDTDVVFLKDHEATFREFCHNGYALQGEVCASRGGLVLFPRVHPWHCFIDLEQVRSKGIRFHCPVRSMQHTPNGVYDAGASMYEDCLSKGLTIGNVNGNRREYYHYEGMSWRVAGYTEEGVAAGLSILNNNSHADVALKVLGEEVAKEYFQVRNEPSKVVNVYLSRYIKM